MPYQECRSNPRGHDQRLNLLDPRNRAPGLLPRHGWLGSANPCVLLGRAPNQGRFVGIINGSSFLWFIRPRREHIALKTAGAAFGAGNTSIRISQQHFARLHE